MPRCAIACAANSSFAAQTLGITTIYVTHDQSEAMALGPHRRHAKRRDGPDRTPREIYFYAKKSVCCRIHWRGDIVEAPIESNGRHFAPPGGRQPIGGNATRPVVVAMIRPETIRVVEAGSSHFPEPSTASASSATGNACWSAAPLASFSPSMRQIVLRPASAIDRAPRRTRCRPSFCHWRGEQRVHVGQANPYRETSDPRISRRWARWPMVGLIAGALERCVATLNQLAPGLDFVVISGGSGRYADVGGISTSPSPDYAPLRHPFAGIPAQLRFTRNDACRISGRRLCVAIGPAQPARRSRPARSRAAGFERSRQAARRTRRRHAGLARDNACVGAGSPGAAVSASSAVQDRRVAYGSPEPLQCRRAGGDRNGGIHAQG